MKSTTSTETPLTVKSEVKSALSLSGIFGIRMLAIFMFIPIFTAYAQNIPGSTPILMGIALGIYGLTQAIFQIPFGAWSDKLGRKPMIFFGLVLFFIGSLIGALANDILWIIFARTLQGAGAVGSTLIALLADLTSEKNRTKAMAAIGISMGVFSALAMITGPAIAAHFGLSGVFMASALLTLVSVSILYGITPNPAAILSPGPQSNTQSKKTKNNGSKNTLLEGHLERSTSLIQLFQSVLKKPVLLSLNAGIFLLHAIFTAMFYACSLILKPLIPDTAFFYLPILVIAFLLLFPCIYLAEKKQRVRLAFIISIALLCVSQFLLLFFHANIILIGAALSLFFLGFNFLEASLPSLVSKIAPPETKGTAMGVYSSSQFLGIFVGGTSAGIIFPWIGATGIFIFTMVLSILWLGIAIAFQPKQR